MGSGGDPAYIKVGIIGFGNAGRLIHAPLLAETPGFRLAAVASQRPDAVLGAMPGMPVYTDPLAMLSEADIDLAIVATEPEHHARWAIATLAAGKHALVEKPFTVTMAEAREVLGAAKAANRVLSVFQNRRFDSCFKAVRAAVGTGQLGRVNHFESHYVRFDPAIMPAWQDPPRPGSGAWFDLGAHIVDQLIQLFGVPEAIGLTLATNRPGCAVDDWFQAVVHYPEMRAVLHASFLVAGGVPRFIIHGDKASLVKRSADRQGHQLWAGLSPAAPDFGLDGDPPQLIDAAGTVTDLAAARGDFRAFYLALGKAIRGTGPNPTPAAEVLAVMAVLEAGFASARSGQVVAVRVPEAA